MTRAASARRAAVVAAVLRRAGRSSWPPPRRRRRTASAGWSRRTTRRRVDGIEPPVARDPRPRRRPRRQHRAAQRHRPRGHRPRLPGRAVPPHRAATGRLGERRGRRRCSSTARRIPTREAPARPVRRRRPPPEWRKVSNAPVASWHDHRTHWMGDRGPAGRAARPRPASRRDPGLEDPAASTAARALTVDRRRDVGPGPVAVAVGASARSRSRRSSWSLCRTRPWVGGDAGRAGRADRERDDPRRRRVAGRRPRRSAAARSRASTRSAGSSCACSRCGGCGARTRGRRRPAVLIAGLFVFVAGGLADVTTLTRSQLPTTLPDGGRAGSPSPSRSASALGLVIAAGVPACRPRRRPAGAEPAPTPVPTARPLTRQAGAHADDLHPHHRGRAARDVRLARRRVRRVPVDRAAQARPHARRPASRGRPLDRPRPRRQRAPDARRPADRARRSSARSRRCGSG